MFQLHGFSEKYQPSVNIAPKRDAQSGIRAFLKEISSKNNTQEPGNGCVIFTLCQQISKFISDKRKLLVGSNVVIQYILPPFALPIPDSLLTEEHAHIVVFQLQKQHTILNELTSWLCMPFTNLTCNTHSDQCFCMVLIIYYTGCQQHQRLSIQKTINTINTSIHSLWQYSSVFSGACDELKNCISCWSTKEIISRQLRSALNETNVW